MRNTVIRIVYAFSVFLAAFFLLELFAGGSSTQMTAEIGNASLPVVFVERTDTVSSDEDALFNRMYGMTAEQNAGEVRFALTPISPDRTVRIRIDRFGQTVLSAKAEARDPGGQRLIESQNLTLADQGDGTASSDLSFTNLIEPDTEYLLVIVLELPGASGNERTVRYGTRIRYTTDGEEQKEAESALSFARTFHENTFDKTSQDNLLTWLEPDPDESNNTLQEVTLYNSADEVTWGDLNPAVVAEPIYSITDIRGNSYGIRGSYYVKTEPEQGENREAEYLYYVTESYELRQGTDRFYLMDFKRTMEQVFDPEKPQGSDGELNLGIASPSLSVMQSEDGDTTAFVQNGRLFMVRSSEKMIAYLYGFGEAESTDERDSFQDHDIRIFDVASDGSIDFIVYGYMNAGRHEGEIGVSFYQYSGSHHTLEEKAFLPWDGGWEILQYRVNQCSYYNQTSGKFYLFLDDRLVEADLNACSIRVVEENLSARKAVFSESGSIVALEETQNGELTGKIEMLNLSTLEERDVPAENGEQAVPLGFLGEDLIYGSADPDDAVTDRAGIVMEPMNRVTIVNPDLEVLEDYHQDGYYITAIEIGDNQITLKRVQKDAASNASLRYSPAADDQIVSSDSKETAGDIQTSQSSRYQTTVQIPTGADLSALRYIRPEEVLYEGSRDLTLRAASGTEEEGSAVTYYAYQCFGLISCETDIREAMNAASAYRTGVVADGSGRYLWESTMPDRSEIDALTSMEEGASMEDSMQACLEALLSWGNTSADVAGMIAEQMTAADIMGSAFPDADILDLSGCTMDQVLYYVGQHIPVFALDAAGNSVLIIGYGPENIELYDPAAGSVHLLARSTAETNFEAAGDRFLCAYPNAG